MNDNTITSMEQITVSYELLSRMVNSAHRGTSIVIKGRYLNGEGFPSCSDLAGQCCPDLILENVIHEFAKLLFSEETGTPVCMFFKLAVN